MKKIEDLAEFALHNKSLSEVKGGVYEYATQQMAVFLHRTGDYNECSDVTYTTQGDNGDTTNKTCTVADCP